VTSARDDLPGRIVDSIDEHAIFALDPHGVFIWWNHGAERMTGFTAEEVLGTHTRRFYEPEAVAAGVPERMMAIANARDYYHVEAWRVDRSGRRFWASVTLNAIRDDGGKLIGFGGVTADQTAQHFAAEALRESEGRLRSITEAVSDGIVTINAAQRIVSFNSGASRLYGRTPADTIGESVEVLVPPRLRDQALALMRLPEPTEARRARSPVGRRFETFALHRDGHEVPIELTIDGWTLNGEPHLVGVVRDITERKQAQTELQRLADRDALTGLFNRRRFETELSRVVAEVQRDEQSASLLVLDLDGFKEINDRYGHTVGDELIIKIGALLIGSVRHTDVVGRLGGDEFGILLRDADGGRAREIAAKLTMSIRTHGLSVGTGQLAPVTVSTGITEVHGGENRTAQELLTEADSAMYLAKAQGRNRFHVHEPDAVAQTRSFERRSWLGRLRRALDQDLFELHSQPIVAISDGRVERHELLLRLCDEPEPLLPGAFLGDAERFDLIGDIDRWVLARAVRLVHDARRQGRDLAVAVNLSGKTMNDDSLVGYLQNLLSTSPIPAGSLLVEVTETAAIVNLAGAADLARELRALGCEFALDDFGSGFSSLLYLKHLDFDYLKIDGEFIEHLVATPTDQLVVRAVVEIARGLGTRTIAECVPDDATVALLAELGVDYGQGYHLGRPKPMPLANPAEGLG
jgi:diguanylate cyclase (GGDEF)-like protein/PAS domain S-box-containing protein